MEPWQHVFRNGFAPGLSTAGLTALATALRFKDKRLATGATTVPAPLMCAAEWPCEAACPMGFCGWQGEGLETVGEVEEFFFKANQACDERMGYPGSGKEFLNWWDDTPADRSFVALAEEVDAVLADRCRDK